MIIYKQVNSEPASSHISKSCIFQMQTFRPSLGPGMNQLKKIYHFDDVDFRGIFEGSSRL